MDVEVKKQDIINPKIKIESAFRENALKQFAPKIEEKIE